MTTSQDYFLTDDAATIFDALITGQEITVKADDKVFTIKPKVQSGLNTYPIYEGAKKVKSPIMNTDQLATWAFGLTLA